MHELTQMVIIIVGTGDNDLYIGLSNGQIIIEFAAVEGTVNNSVSTG